MPLLGAIGNASEYAYRGNLDDWPNEFVFAGISSASPGTSYTTGITTITGINYKAKVSISGSGSFSVNGGAFNTDPKIIRNNDTVSIKVDTTSATLADFSKTYISTLRVGKRSADWVIITRPADITPTTFSFTGQTNREISTLYTSNTVTVNGLESGVAIPVSVTSGLGSFSVNGGSYVYNGTIQNGNTLNVRQLSSGSYSTQVTTNILVGSFTTSFSVTTRAVDLTPDQFTFTDQTGVAFNSVIESNAVVISGIDTGFSAVASVSGSLGAEIKIEDSLGNTIFPYSATSYPVTNGNRLRTRVRSSEVGSTTTSSTVTIGSVSDTFSVTTRVPIVKTVPNQFTFNDLTNQGLNSSVISNNVTLTGMTPGSFGTATITNGTFRVNRLGLFAENLTTYQVQNGDQISLVTTTPSSPEQTKDVVFTVSGTDNTTLPAVPGSTSDIWSVRTRDRDCIPDMISNQFYGDAPLNTTLGFSISNVSGFENDCSVKVSVDPTTFAYVETANGTGTGNVSILPNGYLNVYLTTSPNYNERRSTTVTLKSDFRTFGSSFTVTATTKNIDYIADASFITAGPGDQIPQSLSIGTFDDGVSDGFWDPRDPNSQLLKYRAVRPKNHGGPTQQNWFFRLENFDYVEGIAFQWSNFTPSPWGTVGGSFSGAGQIGWYGGDVRSGPRRTDLASSVNYSVNTWIVPTSNTASGYFTIPSPPEFRPEPVNGVDNPPLNYNYFSDYTSMRLQAYLRNPSTGIYEYKGFVGNVYSFAVRSCTQTQYNDRISRGLYLP